MPIVFILLNTYQRRFNPYFCSAEQLNGTLSDRELFHSLQYVSYFSSDIRAVIIHVVVVHNVYPESAHL